MKIPTEGLKGTRGMLRIRPITWAKESTSQGDDHRTLRKDGGRFARRDRGRTGLMILFLTSAHNSMSQRAYVELTRLGHEVSIGLATSERAMFEAVERHAPDLIIAPMLKRAIPEGIWREHVCIIVHPGPDPSYHEARRRFVNRLVPDYPAPDPWPLALRPSNGTIPPSELEKEDEHSPLWKRQERGVLRQKVKPGIGQRQTSKQTMSMEWKENG